MVARLLTALLLLLQVVIATESASAGELCRKCHPIHYAERGACIACHRGNPASERKNIAHSQLVSGRFARFTLGDGSEVRQGVRLIEQYACRRCHVIAGRGNRLSVNLDTAANLKKPEDLAASIHQPVRSMPDFRSGEEEITAIVNALLAASARQRPTGSSQPQVVHFSSRDKSGRDIFSRRCGSCHSMLSERLGALGSGSNIGPNLSGLYSPFYPKTYRNRSAWKKAALTGWLNNPRELRAWARMQPVKLTLAERRELESILVLQQRSAAGNARKMHTLN